jgi:hypothetical protein
MNRIMHPYLVYEHFFIPSLAKSKSCTLLYFSPLALYDVSDKDNQMTLKTINSMPICTSPHRPQSQRHLKGAQVVAPRPTCTQVTQRRHDNISRQKWWAEQDHGSLAVNQMSTTALERREIVMVQVMNPLTATTEMINFGMRTLML